MQFGVLFTANSMTGNRSTHFLLSAIWWIVHLNVYSSNWLNFSTWPEDSGWYPEPMLKSVPNILHSSFQNFPMKRGSLSEMITLGIPWSFPTWRQNRAATSLADILSLQGRKWHILVALSTTVKIVSNPSYFGIPTMKSNTTWSHFLTGNSNGCNCPPGFKWLPFSTWHTGQSKTNSRTSAVISVQ